MLTALVILVVSLPFVAALLCKPTLRSLAVRNAVRRPGQALLVLLGVVIATAVVTSAGVVGDSLRASVRHSALTQLGPVDEEVLTSGITASQQAQTAISQSPATSHLATLPLLSLSSTVVGKDFVARIAVAQVLEVDFAAAERFGAPGSSGISGPTPTGDHAVISADLALALALAPGHHFSIAADGTSRTFVVDRVLPRRGVAGLAPVGQTAGSQSLNLFVPLGTLHALEQANPSLQPTSVLAVANPSRTFNAPEAARVARDLQSATVGVPVQVQPVKQLLLDDAASRSHHFTQLFDAFGFFSVLGGFLLLMLTFLMLARDRARSMGVLRATGLRRSSHVLTLSVEGWLYAAVGTAAGALAGVGVGALVVQLARSVFASPTAGQVELVVSASSSSIARGAVVGFVASLAIVLVTAVVASRRNIVRMIKGQPPTTSRFTPVLRWALGWALVGMGASGLAVGLVLGNGPLSILAPAVFALGLVLVVPRHWTNPAAMASATAVFLWALLALQVLPHAFVGLSITSLVAAGVVLCASALTLVVGAHAVLSNRTEPRRGHLALSLGIAYSRTARARTTLLISMYAVALFTVTLLLTVGQLYSQNAATVAHRLGGAASLEVSSDATRPVPVADVAALAGVTHVASTALLSGQIQDGTAQPTAVAIVGFDTSFIGHGSPPGSSAQTFASLLVPGRPARVIVGADLHADLQSGLPGRSVQVGDTVTVSDPQTGVSVPATVAGLVTQGRWAGADHVFVSQAVARALSRATPGNLLYVETASGTNSAVVAAIVDGTHLQNGAYARSFATLADETLSSQHQFLDIGAGYAALGLLAALAGIGVLMVDRVRDRRRQIAMLRALGFSARTLRRTFRVEATVIATEGIVAGVGAGLMFAWRLGAGISLGSHLAFSLPPAIAAVVVVSIIASLAASSLAARRAGRLQPAPALKSE